MDDLQKLKIAIETLKLYGDPDNWLQRYDEMVFIPFDKETLLETKYKYSGGKCAREALKEIYEREGRDS